ncbi:MAG: alpha/beta hydrolase-fold protein [Gemmataceae bacterium]
MRHSTRLAFGSLMMLSVPMLALAQPPGGQRPEPFNSPEVSAERKVTFRIYAPKAENVRLSCGDMPGLEQGGAKMKKSDKGVWEVTVGPAPAGAYRYNFNVDGVSVIDPRNPATSESNANTWSLVNLPGSDLFDMKQVPHGAVAQVSYYSTTLKRFRRMHVYTPPGYEKGDAKYPIFYLLHGAMDCDASWSTVGRAGVILDNLIASGKAKPMVVAMPAGHTGSFSFGGGGGNSFNRQMDEFGDDFTKDLKPYVESNYRVKTDRANRAIAGLSMGGAQTLNVAFAHLEDYSAIGVFSSGVFGITGGPGGGGPNTQWEEKHKATLDNAELKKGLKTVWFGIGKEDFLLDTSNATVKMLKSHKFDVVNHETDGGHTWLNWRDYLAMYAPMLFKD